MIGIPLGLLSANAIEWGMHRYVLHGLGRRRGTFWAFHFHEHHREVRQHAFYDPNYERFPLGRHAQGKEAWALIAGAAAATPLLPVAPFFTGTLWYAAANYYRKHKKAHQDPAWGRAHLGWHYDHHMGPNPSANWCVTRPFFDYVMRTREYTDPAELESNIFGLATLPRWLELRLPDPQRLARRAPGPGEKARRRQAA